MSYSEIEASFLRFEERFAKVKLLYMILIDLLLRVDSVRQTSESNEGYSLVTPDPEAIMPLLTDTYGLLVPLGDLPARLLDIKLQADFMSTEIRLFHQQALLPMSGVGERSRTHNERMVIKAKGLQNELDTALEAMEQGFGFRREIREEGIALKVEGTQ